MRIRSSGPILFMLVSCVCLFTVADLAVAQPSLGVRDTMETAFKASKGRRDQLNAGAEKAASKDKAVAEAVAQWFILRATHRFEKDDYVADFAKEIGLLTDKKNLSTKRPYIDMLGKECVENMKQVLARDIVKDPQSIIKGSQMLPTMAKLRQDDVSTYLIDLINDGKTHDVIRLHALKAMKEVMPIRLQLDPLLFDNQGNREDFKDDKQSAERKRDTKEVDGLATFIERKVKVDNMTPGDVATLRFVRREAVIALASAGAPAVSAMAKPRAEAGFVAPTLMRVIAKNGGITPTPSLQEKVEAAIGLCHLEYPNMPEYNAELAVPYVALAILDFTHEYNKDWSNFSRVSKDKQLPYHAYKVDAKRLKDALGKLSDHAGKGGNPAAQKSAKQLVDRTQKQILDKIVIYEVVGVPVVEDLERFVQESRPKMVTTFKTLKAAEIPE